MRRLRAWALRVLSLVDRRRRERDLADEIDSHLQLHEDDNLRRGMTPGEARRAALVRFGGVESAKERYRDRRGVPVAEHLVQDLRYATRLLLRHRGFTAVAVGTFALGIGVNAAIFTVLNAVVLRPWPVADSGRLFVLAQRIDGVSRGVHGVPSMFSYAEYETYRDRNHVASELIAFASVEATLLGPRPQPIVGALASCNYFGALRVRPALGRLVSPADCAAGAAPAVVVSHAAWQARFAADPALVGRQIVLNRASFTVIGVTEPGFRGTDIIASDFWLPVTLQRTLIKDRDFLTNAGMSWLIVAGRLDSGASLGQARADLRVIAAQIDKIQPGRVTRLSVERATFAALPEIRAVVVGVGGIVLIAVGLVLMIACANIANLLLVRMTERARELTLRLAIGASRARLAQQLLTETLLLALAGGALGTLVAWWGTGVAVRFAIAQLPGPSVTLGADVIVDVRVLVYALSLSLLTGVVAGLAPAWRSARVDLVTALKDDGRSHDPRRTPAGWLRATLVTVQVALCTVLLVAAGLLLRGLYRANTLDPGFELSAVTAASFDLRGAAYDDRAADRFLADVAARVAVLPGVAGVARVRTTPLGGAHVLGSYVPSGHADAVAVELNAVSPPYFQLLRIPVLRGRGFTDRDVTLAAPIAIVTEAAARRLWPDRDAVGQTLRDPDGPTLTVVGVAKDAHVSALPQGPRPYIYVVAGMRDAARQQLLVRGDRTAVARGIRSAVDELDRDVGLDVAPLEENLEVWRAPARLTTALAAGLGALGLLLACLGVYGTVAYGVSRRVHEIGIRVALGATARDVMRLVIAQAMRPVTAGAAIGIPACAAVSAVLSSQLFGVSPHDAVAFAAAPAALLAAALLAAYVPARRALAVDPMVALRHD